MAICYINPGYASLLDSSSLVTVSADSTYSKTGSSFLCGEYDLNEGAAQTTFTDSKLANLRDFWFSVDFYARHPLTEEWCTLRFDFDYFFVTAHFNYDSFVTVQLGQDSTGSSFEGDAKTLFQNSYLRNQINNLRGHVTLGENVNGGMNIVWRVSLNGCELQEATDRYDFKESMQKFFVGTPLNIAYISNIIISDAPIKYGEVGVSLPASATYTDWTAGQDGLYIADAANQTLMQSPDVSNLISAYGASAKVTSVMVRANPAYRTNEGLTMIQSQYQNGDTLTAGDAPITLSNSTLGSAFDGFTFDKLTLQNFQNMQFGWKALEAGE